MALARWLYYSETIYTRMSQIRAFSPNLHLIESHVEEFDVRGVVIIGQDTTVVWDTLCHPRDMQPVLSSAKPDHTVVVYSHADWDHIWGISALPYQKVIVHRACHDRFFADVPTYLEERRQREPGVWEEVVLVPPTVTFDSKMNIDLGGMTVELHHLPGHTRDCCVAFIPKSP